ncbi:hypothetical protein D3C74_364890 [compost metagenome]
MSIVNGFPSNAALYSGAWQQKSFRQKGDQTRLIHFPALLVEESEHLRQNAFHAAFSLGIGIQALKRNAVHRSFY